ncbi:hypothetical protein SAMN05660668_02814 [Pseudobutyrivibrio sp. AR14]|nr:hypothetical protein SAMN05660668_02814 [Pseudobutyrivibrio sp. AR14]
MYMLSEEYKRQIIDELLGKEAKDKGFKQEYIRKGLSSNYLGLFKRIVSGKSQGFDIYEDLIHEGKISLLCMGDSISYTYVDEFSFKEVISKFATYMREIGYKKMDESLQMKTFEKDDIALFVDSYINFAEKCFAKNNIDYLIKPNDLSVLLKKELEELFEIEFDKAKEILMEIAGTIAYYSLKNNDKVTIDKKENWLIITIQKYSRDGYPFFKEHNILYIIYRSYQMKNAAIIEKIINDVIGK